MDWSARSLPYRLVQRPGPDNALGRIKFMFPNEHAVYLHDTPSRDLFERNSRAFSSGCIRVENPFELAEYCSAVRSRASELEPLVASGRTETVFLTKPLTVMLLYWTTEVDAERAQSRSSPTFMSATRPSLRRSPSRSLRPRLFRSPETALAARACGVGSPDDCGAPAPGWGA